jgi:hypothetical protein
MNNSIVTMLMVSMCFLIFNQDVVAQYGVPAAEAAEVLEPVFLAKSIVVNGRGANQKAAIEDALAQALIATRGVQIVAQEDLASNSHKVRVEDTKTTTGGYISSYDLLSSSRGDDGEVVVRICAFILTNPGGRIRVAVLPFSIKGAKVDAEGIDLAVLSNEIALKLSEKLSEVGDFTIIEGVSERVDPEIKNNFPGQFGADYIVSGVITELSTDFWQSPGGVVFRGSMKITKVATGERIGRDSVFEMSYIGKELMAVYLTNRAVGANKLTLCVLESTAFWAKRVEVMLGAVTKVCALTTSSGRRGQDKNVWMFTLANDSGSIERDQVFDVFIQDLDSHGGTQVTVLSEILLSVKVVGSEGNFASAKMHSIRGESIEDFLETLKNLDNIISDNRPGSSVIAKRRL